MKFKNDPLGRVDVVRRLLSAYPKAVAVLIGLDAADVKPWAMPERTMIINGIGIEGVARQHFAKRNPEGRRWKYVAVAIGADSYDSWARLQASWNLDPRAPIPLLKIFHREAFLGQRVEVFVGESTEASLGLVTKVRHGFGYGRRLHVVDVLLKDGRTIGRDQYRFLRCQEPGIALTTEEMDGIERAAENTARYLETASADLGMEAARDPHIREELDIDITDADLISDRVHARGEMMFEMAMDHMSEALEEADVRYHWNDPMSGTVRRHFAEHLATMDRSFSKFAVDELKEMFLNATAEKALWTPSPDGGERG